jgi:hypothetical protein
VTSFIVLFSSAADLYVTKHLDPYLRKMGSTSQSLLLRIVSKERRLAMVPDSVRKYCNLNSEGTAFDIPESGVVRQFRVVITTVEMSLFLRAMDLQVGFLFGIPKLCHILFMFHVY